jgi:lipopolysaccharide biosynthesis glycosyltransferase
MAENCQGNAGVRLKPAFFPNNLPVVFSADDFYAPVLGVLIKSICETRSFDMGYDLIILHGGLAPNRIAALLQVVQGYDNVSLRFVNVSMYVQEQNLYKANRSDLSKEAYYRLLIPDLFPRYEKMLYLDCDMIAVEDISAIFDVDMGDCCIAAVRDSYSFRSVLTEKDKIQKNAGSQEILQATLAHRYFNSGLVLFDLRRIRREIDFGLLWKTAMAKPWPYHDQDVLNHVFAGCVHFLHCRWNFCDVILLDKKSADFPQEIKDELSEAAASPGIVHYLFPCRKPWQNATKYSIAYFWPVAVRSSFYDELLGRQLKFAEEIIIVKTRKGADETLSQFTHEEDTKDNVNQLTAYEISLSQQRLILQSMLQNKELEYRLRGKTEEDARRRLALLGLTDGNVDKIRRVTPKRILSFEISICGHCNMKCRGCAHFAPLVKEDYADFPETDRAFTRLGQLFNGEAESIHLLGGEPLLHPQINDFMKSVRRHFPVGRIELVTNGLMLPNMEDSFWNTCRENKIQVSVTKYPVEFDYIAVQALAAYHGVVFGYYNNSDLTEVTFNRLPLDLSGAQDPDNSFLNCYLANTCITLKNGRLFPCSIAPNMAYFAERFGGLDASREDSIDIFHARDKEEILEFLSLPFPLCRYCDSVKRIPFEQWGTSKCEIEEWTL